MAWKIDRDYISEVDEKSRVGVSSPNADGELPVRFRILDDDGIVYYGGRASKNIFEIDDDNPEGLYSALEFGAWDAGATALQVRAQDMPDVSRHRYYNLTTVDNGTEWVWVY